MADFYHHEDQGLWGQISQWLQPQEVEEVKLAIGPDLIDRNLSLVREVAALAQIVDEFRDKNTELEQASIREREQRTKLLSGGHERQLLEQQIRMLLGNIQQEHTLSRSDSKVLEYFNQSSSQPCTARRPTSSLSTSRLSARSAPDALEALTDRLNVFEIDSVLDDIRRMFDEESRELMGEVELLMRTFESEDQDRKRIESNQDEAIPSTSELRDFGSRLEKKWLTQELSTTGPETPAKKTLPSLHSQFQRSKNGIPPLRLSTEPNVPTTKPSRLVSRIRGAKEVAERSREDFHLSDEKYFI